MSNAVQSTDFDKPANKAINEARAAWVRRALPIVVGATGSTSAHDFGCGAGYFSAILAEAGLTVRGYDLQEPNLAACRARVPGATFEALDLDAMSAREAAATPPADLGFFFGILYHLRSPLRTIEYLAPRIRHACLISSRTTKGERPFERYYAELDGAAHSTAQVTAVPTRSALLLSFAVSGFAHLYETRFGVDHPQWDPTATPDGLRYTFIASRTPIEHADLKRVEPPKPFLKWRAGG